MATLTSFRLPSRRQIVRAGMAVLAGACLTGAALAQSWPSKPITIIIGYPPGGGADIMARLVGQKMSVTLGQPVIVDNRVGSAGQIAAAAVARSAPDGYTVLVDASAFAINPGLYPKLPYKPASFETVGVIAKLPLLVVVNPAFPAKSIEELVSMAKAKPGSIFYATSGSGSLPNLAAAVFESQAGVELTQVPYKGAGSALNDVMGGQVPLYFANAAAALPYVKAGKLRPLSITSGQRSKELPEVRTLREAKIGNIELYEWNAMFAPAGTPAAITDRLSAALRQVLAAPDVLERLSSLSAQPFAGSRADSAQFVQSEITRFGQLIRDRKITID